MYKKLFFLILFFTLFTKTAYAGSFNLTSIGNLNTSGQQISHWWYSGLNPVLKGEMLTGNTVKISINGIESEASITDSTWSYNPGTLSEGDHDVVLTSGDSTISFTLTLGTENINWEATKKGDGERLPTVGVIFPTLILITIAGFSFLTAKKLI